MNMTTKMAATAVMNSVVQAPTAASAISSAEESCTGRDAHHSEDSPGWGFMDVSFVEDKCNISMHSFCLLASMELILIPNCTLMNLHSNDRTVRLLFWFLCYNYKYHGYIYIYINLEMKSMSIC